jgi:hypothetical protein
MKKVFLLVSILAIFLSACGTPAAEPTTVPTMAFTNTPSATETPAPTETPLPTPTPIMPYAIVSSDKAEFWFPLPNKEWEWKITTKAHSCRCNVNNPDSAWLVTIVKADGKEYQIGMSYTYPAPADEASVTTQTGSIEEFFKLLEVDGALWYNSDHTSGESLINYSGLTASLSNGGILIVVTDQNILKILNDTKPAQIEFNLPVEDGSNTVSVPATYK